MWAVKKFRHVPLQCFKTASRSYELKTVQVRLFLRKYSQDVGTGKRRRFEWKTANEQGSAAETPFAMGQAALIGGGVFAIGALCFYGSGMGSKPGFISHADFWPEYVKQRIHSTYMYFGASLLITGAAAIMTLRSPLMLDLVTRNGYIALAGTLAAMIGTGELCRSITYRPGLGLKQAAWILHTSVMGAVIAPVCLLGGPIVARAAWLTAGVVGGLSLVAATAPSDTFLKMAGPLGMGLGVVVASSIGSFFLPPTGLLGASLYSISLYGGLLVMSGLLMYDTQRIIQAAENQIETYDRPFDPINMSIGIYLDTINIFIRIAMLLGDGDKRRR